MACDDLGRTWLNAVLRFPPPADWPGLAATPVQTLLAPLRLASGGLFDAVDYIPELTPSRAL